MSTPFDRPLQDLWYFFKCCIPLIKEGREKRLEKIGHCPFWFINKTMAKNYKDLKNKSILIRKLKHADYVYQQFEKDFGFCEHEEWCIYHKCDDQLREGVKKLGKTLHGICHSPVELVQYRTVGLHLFDQKIDLEKVKESVFCETEHLNFRKCLEGESVEAKRCRFILRKEQFKRHYFEVTSLRDILSEEIQLQHRLTSSLKGWIGIFSTGLITGVTMLFSKEIPYLVSLTIFRAFGALLLLGIIWHIWASIKLNEAKDVMYMCLGVDLDNPKITSDPIPE